MDLDSESDEVRICAATLVFTTSAETLDEYFEACIGVIAADEPCPMLEEQLEAVRNVYGSPVCQDNIDLRRLFVCLLVYFCDTDVWSYGANLSDISDIEKSISTFVLTRGNTAGTLLSHFKRSILGH